MGAMAMAISGMLGGTVAKGKAEAGARGTVAEKRARSEPRRSAMGWVHQRGGGLASAFRCPVAPEFRSLPPSTFPWHLVPNNEVQSTPFSPFLPRKGLNTLNFRSILL